MELLFDVTVKSLQTSSLITEEDRDFLLNHWNMTISSTLDRKTKVEKKLTSQEKRRKFSSAHSSPKTPNTLDPNQLSDSSPNISLDSGEEFTPKRTCTPRATGTTVEITKDVLKKLGPAADRLNLSNNVLTSVVAAVANHGGGNIDDLSLSKSTARRQRASARSEQAASIREKFTCNAGQINFDGKLLSDLKGFGKVNRLAVVRSLHSQDRRLHWKD